MPDGVSPARVGGRLTDPSSLPAFRPPGSVGNLTPGECAEQGQEAASGEADF